MLPRTKALYQVKLILDYLPEEEYKLIPQEEIDYIEENFEYDENISIYPDIPLEKQKIDDKAYEVLKRIMKKIDYKGRNEIEKENKINDEIKNIRQEDYKNENIKLKEIIESLKKENSKIGKAKELITQYREEISLKDNEIEKLKKNNQELYDCIQRIPKIIRRFFIKEKEIKMLNFSKQID